MFSVNENKKMIVSTAVGVLAAGVAAYAYYHHTSMSKTKTSSSSSMMMSKKAKEDSERHLSLTKEQTVQVIDEIVLHMSNVMMQLAKIEQKVRQESTQTGTSVPEDQLALYLAQNFEGSLKQISEQVYTKHQTTEEEVEDAVKVYGEDENVRGSMFKLQQIIAVATGQPIESVKAADGSTPEDIPLEKLMTIVEDTFDIMAQTMEETCEGILAEKIDKSKVGETLQTRYTQKADEQTLKIFEKYGISREAFHNATIKHGQDPEFLKKMQVLQERQAIRFKNATAALDIEE